MKYKIGDILENPWNPGQPAQIRRFIYMGANNKFVKGIMIDGGKLKFSNQLFYKNTVLHPEREHNPEGREFKVIGHSKGFELIYKELGGNDE